MESLQNVIGKLEDLFFAFNQKFYDGKLVKPIITVSPDVMAGSYGWCTTGRVWKKTDTEDESFYEINLCAEYLSRPILEISATLLHEMVHLWNIQNNVKDTSRGYTYHNRKFKDEAEKRGLIIEHTEKYGWTKTSLSEDATEFIKSMCDKDLGLSRTAILAFEKSKGKSKSSSRKYVCPDCGLSIRATKEVRITCTNCQLEMELAEAES